jgi:hypothetical protein
MGGQRHDPPVTVLAEDELPVLADPVDSDDELLDEEELLDVGDGVAVLDDDMVVDEVDVPLEVPAWVCAAANASAATATVPITPDEAMSRPRSRSARSRSAGVIRRLRAAISVGPAGARPPLAVRPA